ncbi:MAG TPA: NmrA family NAD(P)-binding protein [Chitinophaga sp.]|uniref:NmrA family NAD(P)-binding protein n=1 Tax=Chitinophaga sp. TaxID=1869181 RepID=UPI002D14D5F1|nr:NmrA family NAD(P)-binding protein [Chitinophaga sp.]HVI47875.1 NmrA family NAD(P)-binding protein [Chitinophaga sp.]
MKIIVTGSLGNISRPLAEILIAAGHVVTVISSNPAKQQEIKALGAIPAIGELEDVPFLIETFTNADAVYCMTPSNITKDQDQISYYSKIGNSYAQAIRQTGIKHAVYLSSFGAHLDKGTGIILGSHHVEGILNELPDTTLTHIRPASFYYNLYAFADMIKEAGFIAANYGGGDNVLWVSPLDIAAAVAEEIIGPGGNKINIRYVASDERSCNEVARILGEAIGKPDLKWLVVSDEQAIDALEAKGLPTLFVAHLVELYAALHKGILTEDYYKHPPVSMGKVKLEDFAKDFALVFNKK